MSSSQEWFPYMKVRAIMKPRRLDDLKPSAVKFIGREGTFTVDSKFEDGKFAGQWSMSIPLSWIEEQGEEFHEFEDGFAWVPSGDLEILHGGE